MNELTQARLKGLLHYSPETGVFTWIVSRRKRLAGDIAGTQHSLGYINIGTGGKVYLAHRLAFLYVEGEFPPDQVDHINKIRDDNRWENLRHATQYSNHANTKNNNPFIGVGWCKRKGKWRVQGRETEGKAVYLGFYTTYLAACYARHAYNLTLED